MLAYSIIRLCLTLGDPVNCSRPGISVHGIFQTRILKWVAISSSRISSWPRDWTHIQCMGRWILYHWATWEAQWESSWPNTPTAEYLRVSSCSVSFFFFNYLFLAVLGLYCCLAFSLGAMSRGYFLFVMPRLLIAVACVVAEHGL